MRHIAFPLLLVGVFTACSDHSAPVEPASAAAPTEAVAAKNPRQPTPVEYTFDAEGLCDFTVRFEVSGKEKQIDLPGDRMILTSPGLTAVLKNLDNDKSERFVITGSFHVTSLKNGGEEWVSTGRSILWDPEEGFVLAVGRFTWVFDAEGNLIQPLQGKGQLIDLCELLA